MLNTERYLRIQKIKNNGISTYNMQFKFDPVALKNLKDIVEKTDAYIVLSSTWRINKEVEDKSQLWNEFINNMKVEGLEKRVIGTTPVLMDNEKIVFQRCNEIKQWLTENTDKNIEKFVIIDDEWEMGEYTNTNFARCWSYSGLNNEVKEKVLDILAV